MRNFSIQEIADYITIIMFVISAVTLIGASIAKRFTVWIKSVLNEWLEDWLNK